MKKLFVILFALSVLMPTAMFAAVGGGGGGGVGGGGGGGVGGGSSNTVVLENPLGEVTSFEELVKTVLEAAFVIGFPVAVLFIVIAGFRFVWARGKPGELEKAKTNLLYTVIGIGIFFGAWVLAEIIVSTISALRIGGS